MGVADLRMAPLIAGVFAGRGKDAVVFRGDDGLDELTISTTSSVWWVRAGQVREHRLDPEQLGLRLHPLETLRGADAAHNAGVVREVLAGATGPVRDAVVLNAGIALALTGAGRGHQHRGVHRRGEGGHGPCGAGHRRRVGRRGRRPLGRRDHQLTALVPRCRTALVAARA